MDYIFVCSEKADAIAFNEVLKEIKHRVCCNPYELLYADRWLSQYSVIFFSKFEEDQTKEETISRFKNHNIYEVKTSEDVVNIVS